MAARMNTLHVDVQGNFTFKFFFADVTNKTDELHRGRHSITGMFFAHVQTIRSWPAKTLLANGALVFLDLLVNFIDVASKAVARARTNIKTFFKNLKSIRFKTDS